MLLETPENPRPPNTNSGRIETPDSVQLRYGYWRTTRPPSKGTVIILQGRAEFIEKYFETAGELREKGFDVLTFDWRGQGGSSRLLRDHYRGYVDDFDQYVMDLETIFEQIALPDCRPPFYILAHSTGSLAALMAAPRMGNRVRRMLLGSPFAGFNTAPISPGMVKFMSTTLTMVGLGEIYMAGGKNLMVKRMFAGNRLTSDQRRFERNAAYARAYPELTIGGATAAWVSAAARAIDRLWDPDFLGSIAIPTLLVGAGRDAVVSNQAIELLGRRLRAGRCVMISGAKHELLQEADIYREQLMAAFDAFVPGSAEQAAE